MALILLIGTPAAYLIGTKLDCQQDHGAHEDEQCADRQGEVEVDLELGVDRQRQRLRDALEAAGEHDRRAELPDPAGEGERRTGAEAAERERQRDAEEDAGRRCAECARCVDQVLVERLEGGDSLPDIERARDEGHGHHDCHLRERDLEPEPADGRAQETDAAEGGEQADACDRRWQYERQLDEGQGKAPAPEAPPADQVGGRRPEQQDQCHRDRVRLQRDDQRVPHHRIAELADQLPGRDAEEDREQRQQQEQRRDPRGDEETEAEQPPGHVAVTS